MRLAASDLKSIGFFIFALIIVTTLVYLPVLQHDFVNWDDDEYVLVNESIRSLDLSSIKKIFTTNLTGKYHPLTILSFAIEYHFFKLDPYYYHATNLVLHVLNVLLVFVFVRMLLASWPAAFMAALLFSIHPLQVEPVAWVSSRKDMLFMFFYLLGLTSYLYKRNVNPPPLSLLSFASYFFFVLSLLSKAMAISFPLVLILLDYFNTRKFDARAVFQKWGYFLIALGYGLYTLSNAGQTEAFPNTALYPFWERIFYSFLSFDLYLIKLIFPTPLSCYYAFTITWPLLILSVVSAVLGAALIVVTFRNNTLVIFAFLFYVLTIWPVLHLIQMNDSVIYERFMYLPCLGFFILAAASLEKLFNDYRRWVAVGATVFFIGWVSMLMHLSQRQTAVWNNSATLWNHAITHFPQAYPAYNNMGIFLEQQLRFDEALVYYMRMIEINPKFAEGYFKLANILALKFDRNGAIRYYSKAIEYNPKHHIAYNNRGNQYLIQGMYDLALGDYNKALDINSEYVNSYLNRGMCYFAMKDYPRAVVDFNRVLELDPNHSKAKEKLEYIRSQS